MPAFGVESGLDDPALGLTLNRVVKGPPSFRASRRTVVGVVVAEDGHQVIIEQTNGRRVRIPVSDIIERTVMH